ncbi:MAG: uroporphyrinogen-III C-methyltransferase [Planctomycetia bacterium]|nr:uroporphyrinogen-III C-methyltransferase [Planctomycetia bacterium]
MHATDASQHGKVFFVGAGPGNPDLLTIRAVECLRSADVIVYDSLVPQELLDAIAQTTERIPVPRDACDQHDPGEMAGHLLTRLAASGRAVVRLKGGDPSVFARLAEELQPLRDAGILYEIIPGVTAALAAAAAAGVPLTSRSAASSVTILTGHEADENAGGIDFHLLADLPGTLAIYMGVEQAEKWSRSLLAAGKPADTPITIVSRCSWPDQQVAVTSLGQCAADFARYRWPPPAVVIVGEVAQLPHASVLDERPLHRRRVLVTRPTGQGGDITSLVATLGGECLQIPTIRIEPPPSWHELDRAIRDAGSFDWIVFASVNGVRAFVSRLRATGMDGRALGTARLAAIGPATKQELEQSGFVCDLTPESYRSEGLIDALGQSLRAGRFLLIRADRGRELLRQELHSQGHDVCEVVAYASQPVEAIDPVTLEMLDTMQIDWITVTSSLVAESTIRLFGNRMQGWKIASISPITSLALTQAGFAPTVEAVRSTGANLVEAMAQWELAHTEDSAQSDGKRAV